MDFAHRWRPVDVGGGQYNDPMASAESAQRRRAPPFVWLALAAMVVVMMLLAWRGRGRVDGTTHPAVGQQLVFRELAPLTGDATPVTSRELEGTVTLINFWGPWCDYCLREMPHLVRLREKFAARDDVEFLFVSCSPDWRPDTPPALRWREDVAQLGLGTEKLLAQRGWNIPTHYDPHGETRQAFAGLDVWAGYPTTLLVDQGGVIRYVMIGYDAGDEYALEEQLRQLLDPPPSERGTEPEVR
jgi:thiol-disulfide isomerase/thioredoxin